MTSPLRSMIGAATTAATPVRLMSPASVVSGSSQNVRFSARRRERTRRLGRQLSAISAVPRPVENTPTGCATASVRQPSPSNRMTRPLSRPTTSTTPFAARSKKSAELAAVCSTPMIVRSQRSSDSASMPPSLGSSRGGRRSAAVFDAAGGGATSGRPLSCVSDESTSLMWMLLRPTVRAAGRPTSTDPWGGSSVPSASVMGISELEFVSRTRPPGRGTTRACRRDTACSSIRAITTRQRPPSSRLEYVFSDESDCRPISTASSNSSEKTSWSRSKSRICNGVSIVSLPFPPPGSRSPSEGRHAFGRSNQPAPGRAGVASALSSSIPASRARVWSASSSTLRLSLASSSSALTLNW